MKSKPNPTLLLYPRGCIYSKNTYLIKETIYYFYVLLQSIHIPTLMWNCALFTVFQLFNKMIWRWWSNMQHESLYRKKSVRFWTLPRSIIQCSKIRMSCEWSQKLHVLFIYIFQKTKRKFIINWERESWYSKSFNK